MYKRQKLGQAQYREVAAFARFGADLDAVTLRTIQRGKRNEELLKQPAFSPVPLALQLALFLLANDSALDAISPAQVEDFSRKYVHALELTHGAILQELASGAVISAEVEATLRALARQIVSELVSNPAQ